MDKDTVISILKETIDLCLENTEFKLVDLIYKQEGRDLFLRALIDRPEGGINMDECAMLNRKISSAFDEKDIMQRSYVFEVSSPGLDRSLKTKDDFLRCINKNIKFFLNAKVNGKLEWDGIIKSISDDSLVIQAKKEELNIPLSYINKAKQIF